MGEKKTSSYGTCKFTKTSPNYTDMSKKTKILNIFIPFEEALKINLALDECIRNLNTYKRSTKVGKAAAVNIAVHLKAGRVSVHDGKL